MLNWKNIWKNSKRLALILNRIIALPLVLIIYIYQLSISPDHGLPRKLGFTKNNVCVFYPTCSEYAIQALKVKGLFPGVFLLTWRLLRCHPWQKKHIDPLV